MEHIFRAAAMNAAAGQGASRQRLLQSTVHSHGFRKLLQGNDEAHVQSPAASHHLIALLDGDGDGQITWNDFAIACKETTSAMRARAGNVGRVVRDMTRGMGLAASGAAQGAERGGKLLVKEATQAALSMESAGAGLGREAAKKGKALGRRTQRLSRDASSRGCFARLRRCLCGGCWGWRCGGGCKVDAHQLQTTV